MDKIIIFTLLSLTVITMGFLIFSGRKATRSLPSPTAHKWGARILLIITLILVGVIEIGVHTRKELQHLDGLFFVHLLFAIPFFFLIIIVNLWLTGEKSPFHGMWAYALLVLFIGMIATGIPLVLRLP